MKQMIQVRSKNGVKHIKRVLDIPAQYIGPVYCRYKNKKVEVFADLPGVWYINID